MVRPAEYAEDIFEFEELRRYPFCVAVAPEHPFARLEAVPLEKLAAEPIVAFNRRDYSEHFRILKEIFSPKKLKPPIGAEVDGASSLITEVEAGRGAAVVIKRIGVSVGFPQACGIPRARLIIVPAVASNVLSPYRTRAVPSTTSMCSSSFS